MGLILHHFNGFHWANTYRGFIKIEGFQLEEVYSKYSQNFPSFSELDPQQQG